MNRSGALALINRLRAVAPSPWLTVVTYHRVTDTAGRETPFDDGAADVTPASFDRHLRYLKDNFSVVGLDRVLGFVHERQPLPHNPVLITFDDGYLDNHDTALPILRQHGLSATFFVATAFVDERRLFWWDRISYILKKCEQRSLTIAYPHREKWPLSTPANLQTAIRRALQIAKRYAELDMDRFVDGIRDAAAVPLDRAMEAELAEGLVMRWDHVRALRQAGMFIGSHTHRHRVLQTIAPADLDAELRDSRTTLERELGESVRAVAYPVGFPLLSPTVDAVAAAGYDIGFTCGTGLNLARTMDRWNIRRFSLDLDEDDAPFRAMVSVPYFADAHH